MIVALIRQDVGSLSGAQFFPKRRADRKAQQLPRANKTEKDIDQVNDRRRWCARLPIGPIEVTHQEKQQQATNDRGHEIDRQGELYLFLGIADPKNPVHQRRIAGRDRRG